MIDKYILFSVAGTLYALPTERIAHIEMVEHVTRVPNAPRFVDGVVFSRGEVVPAVSLRARFGFERSAFDTRTRLIVVRSGSRVVGLIVDAAREFTTIPESAIKPRRNASRYGRCCGHDDWKMTSSPASSAFFVAVAVLASVWCNTVAPPVAAASEITKPVNPQSCFNFPFSNARFWVAGDPSTEL